MAPTAEVLPPGSSLALAPGGFLLHRRGEGSDDRAKQKSLLRGIHQPEAPKAFAVVRGAFGPKSPVVGGRDPSMTRRQMARESRQSTVIP